VRLTVFWELMREHFGDSYAASVARDFVLTSLGGRTAEQALADGEEPKAVWQAVCEAFDVPERLR
jgi:transcriptional regulator GlxA family with amidase domain